MYSYKEGQKKYVHKISDPKDRYLDNCYFALKLIRRFKDINKYFGKGCSPSLTNSGCLVYYDKEQGRLFYDSVEITDSIENRLTTNELTKEKESVQAFNWLDLESGFIGYKQDKIFYVNVDIEKYVENNELKILVYPKSPEQVGIKMNMYDLFIKEVYRCPDPTKIVICCSTELDEMIFLIWDVKENQEIRNYSAVGDYQFFTGSGSTTGYICNKDNYVDLDIILKNYFFDINFSEHFEDEYLINGYKFNKQEDILLCKGKVILKVTYIDTQTIDNFYAQKETLNEENIYLERIKFQIDGNTILHLFALEFDILNVILNFFEEYRPDYLSMILMKNHSLVSPLDIAIEYDRQKNVELLLTKLSVLKDGSYSHLMYTKFPKLLAMNLRAFYDYLES